ncbi:hypothetical protein [Brachybacterium squillarum]|uniref:hypothetical protein n=1 Tax=Brachybacterium squillarum TaxID=661979 RepID=UPI0002629FEF|nr:hypothetical protein [Brachybacterium squillarum]
MSSRIRPLDDVPLAPVFTTGEAHALGVGPQRLRAPDILTVVRGFRARRDVPYTVRDVVAALQRGRPTIVACGLTAAHLWGLPLPPDQGRRGDRSPLREEALELNEAGSHRRPRPGIIWHHREYAPAQVVLRTGLRLTTRVTTWRDLGAVLPVDHLVIIGDHLVRVPRPGLEGRDEPYATVEDLRAVLRDWSGRGARALRDAVELIRVGSDSPAETRLRLACARAGLPPPRRNERIHGDGVDPGVPDSSWDEWRVCAEHEGPSHLTPGQLERDIERGERRRRHGWIEVRTTARDLRAGGARAVHRITEALRSRGWSPR